MAKALTLKQARKKHKSSVYRTRGYLTGTAKREQELKVKQDIAKRKKEVAADKKKEAAKIKKARDRAAITAIAGLYGKTIVSAFPGSWGQQKLTAALAKRQAKKALTKKPKKSRGR